MRHVFEGKFRLGTDCGFLVAFVLPVFARHQSQAGSCPYDCWRHRALINRFIHDRVLAMHDDRRRHRLGFILAMPYAMLSGALLPERAGSAWAFQLLHVIPEILASIAGAHRQGSLQ